MVVDGVDQKASVAQRPVRDEITPQPIKLGELSLDSYSLSFFRTLAHPRFMPGLAAA